MVRKLSKTMAVFAVVLVMAVSVISVNAFAADTSVSTSQNRHISTWYLPMYNNALSGDGCVVGLVEGNDDGITFRCRDFINDGGRSDFNAYGEIIDRSICKHPYDALAGVKLTYAGDEGIDYFNDTWFAVTNGDVWYRVSLRNYTYGVYQWVGGTAS